MRFSQIAYASLFLGFATANAFIAPTTTTIMKPTFTTPSTSTTSLSAIGVLARKAKEMDVKKYLESGEVDDAIMEQYKILLDESSEGVDKTTGELQMALTKRKGTVTVIAEYKRKLDKGGFIDEIYDPEILSPTFREFGAAAIAVMADDRMGGCSYDDIKLVKKEQSIAIGDMPGPCFLISNDLIVDDIQIARSAVAGCNAVVLNYGVLGEERLAKLYKSAAKLGLDSIVVVDTTEQAQSAVNIGATILMVTVSSAVEELAPKERISQLDSLEVAEGTKICRIANIVTRDDKGLQEVEDSWVCRDVGFQAIWAADFLYKSGNDSIEHPGAIINSMKAKSSVKWASVKARGGKGEGAREYLGDILM